LSILTSPLAEVILTAVNTEAFGLDTGENLIDLLKAIIEKTAVPRISFGSINLWSLDKKFFSFYKKYQYHQRLVDFFHIPLQSGSNKILKLMKRGYQKNDFAEQIEKLHQINPLAFIASDVIVGFLGESDKDFEETYRFIEKSPIYRLHVFRFSKRVNTAAAFLAQKISEPSLIVKKKRSQALLKLSQKKFYSFQLKHLKKTFSALFIDKFKKNYQPVLLSNQMPALVKTEKNLAGQIKKVFIEQIKNGSLVGKIVG
jgi:threonylcarbamoyladenosine tRNA methylthiotransferase MtaB